MIRLLPSARSSSEDRPEARERAPAPNLLRNLRSASRGDLAGQLCSASFSSVFRYLLGPLATMDPLPKPQALPFHRRSPLDSANASWSTFAASRETAAREEEYIEVSSILLLCLPLEPVCSPVVASFRSLRSRAIRRSLW